MCSGESVMLAPLLSCAWTQWQYLDTGIRTQLVIRVCANRVGVPLFFHRKCRSDGSILWDANLIVLNRHTKMATKKTFY